VSRHANARKRFVGLTMVRRRVLPFGDRCSMWYALSRGAGRIVPSCLQ
jgi:hypothetical protein